MLKHIARDYLAIQGSSVPSERVFSDAGLTDTKCRGSLLPATFGAIQVVKSKYKRERRLQDARDAAVRDIQKKRRYNDAIQQVGKV